MTRSASEELREAKAAVRQQRRTTSDDNCDAAVDTGVSAPPHSLSEARWAAEERSTPRASTGQQTASSKGNSNQRSADVETVPDLNPSSSSDQRKDEKEASVDGRASGGSSATRPGAQRVFTGNRVERPPIRSSFSSPEPAPRCSLSPVRARPGSASVDLRDVRRAIKDQRNSATSSGPSPSSLKQKSSISKATSKASPDRPGLPVAQQMDEEEGEALPTAVQFDADAKPGPVETTKTYLYTVYIPMFMAMILIAIVATAVGLTLSSPSRGPPDVPYRETLGIRENIELVVDPAVLDDGSNPYAKALHWITHEDPLQMTIDHKRFFQRYLIAYLYFATTVNGPWTNGCARATEGQTSRCNIVSNANFAASRRWLSDTSECAWAFVFCDGADQVSKLIFQSTVSGMTGTFPEGIVNLPYLHAVSFAENKFEGPLPSKIGRMKHLSELRLARNGFTGSLPDSLYTSRSLRYVDLWEKGIVGTLSFAVGQMTDLKQLLLRQTALGGTLPRELFELKQLVRLAVRDSAFNGTIPTEIGQLEHVSILQLNDNALSGTIPTEIGQLEYVNELQLKDNILSGTIPTEIGLLWGLQGLNLHNNRLQGQIPSQVYNLDTLWELRLSNNQLQGTLSSELGVLKQLRELQIEHNTLSGTIPETITNILYLRWATFQGNLIEGSVPEGLCESRFEALVADCAPTMNGTVTVACDCCTECCVHGDATTCYKNEW